MEKLDELLARLKETDVAIDELLLHEQLTDEQRADHDRLVAERKKIADEYRREKDRYDREQERLKLEAAAAEARARLEEEKKAEEDKKRREERRIPTPGRARMTDADLPEMPGAGPGGTPAQRQRPYTIPRTALGTTIKNFKGTRNGMDAHERAYRFGMWILSRLRMDIPRFQYEFADASDFVRRHMAVSKSNDSTGYQLTIPEEFGQDVIVLRELYGVARRVMKLVPMASDTRSDPRRVSGLTAYFTSEGAPGTESQKQWDNVRLVVKDLMTLARYTNQVNMDSVINIGDDLAGEIAYAFSLKEDQCAFLGDGTSTYGGIRGTNPKLNDCAVPGAGTVSAGVVTMTGNAWTSAVLADFHKLVGLLPQYADTPAACWVCHRTFYFQVMQKLELAAGGVPAREIQWGGGSPDMAGVMGRGRPLFLGYPVEFSQVFPSTSASTQMSLVFGDFQKGASFGDRQMDQVAFSEHATIGGENVFERNEIAIRGTERIDINVHDVGSATTPGPICGMTT